MVNPRIMDLDEIFEVLTQHEKVDLESLAIRMRIEPETLQVYLDRINEEMPHVIRQQKNENNPNTSVRIPKECHQEVKAFLKDGGWGTYYHDKFEKIKEKQKREDEERQLSIENLKATTKAAEAAESDAKAARREARIANCIAIASILLSALIALFK